MAGPDVLQIIDRCLLRKLIVTLRNVEYKNMCDIEEVGGF